MTSTATLEQRLRDLFVLVAEHESAGSDVTPTLQREGPVGGPTLDRQHRVLASVLVAAVIVISAILAVIYGPNSSPRHQSASLGSVGTRALVGSYAMTYLPPKTSPPEDSGSSKTFFDPDRIRLDLKVNGKFVVPGYVLHGSPDSFNGETATVSKPTSGTWTVSKGTVTLRFVFPDGHFPRLSQTIRQRGPNLGSASMPGVVISNGKTIERWYAVRVQGPSGYEAARIQWIADGNVVATSSQNPPLQLAANDLKRGELTDVGSTSGYGATIANITKFESGPITGVTPDITARENAERSAVNTFFHLPKSTWEGGCDSSGPGLRGAQKSWQTEPSASQSGVHVAPLRRAIADLKHGLATDTGDTSCYAAAMADLQSLESATRTDIAMSITRFNSPLGHVIHAPYGDEIEFLNAFLRGRVLTDPRAFGQ
jgi:hypothetical protein